MEMLTIKAYAKVNFSIDILGIRPDGYHEVAMIMQTIPLADVITITAEPRGPDSAGPEEESAIVIRTTSEALPEDARNLAYRAAAHRASEIGSSSISGRRSLSEADWGAAARMRLRSSTD